METTSVSGDADDGFGGAVARPGAPPAKVAPKRPRAGAAVNPRGRGYVRVPPPVSAVDSRADALMANRGLALYRLCVQAASCKRRKNRRC